MNGEPSGDLICPPLTALLKARASANHRNEEMEIMTVSSLADHLRCSPSLIYRLLKRKEIPAFRLASDWRFFRSAIDDWIEHQ